MTSKVYYRMQIAKSKTLEPITFTGNQIRLLDLQRAIMEKKNMKEGSDFDLVLMDAEDTSKIYSGEDTYIPKNTAVVVRKVVKKAGQGLLSRFGRGAIAAPTDVVVEAVDKSGASMVGEAEVKESDTSSSSSSSSSAIKLTEEEEMRMIGEMSRKLANDSAAAGTTGKSWESGTVRDPSMSIKQNISNTKPTSGFMLDGNVPAQIRRTTEMRMHNSSNDHVGGENIATTVPGLDADRMTGVPTAIINTTAQPSNISGASTNVDLSHAPDRLKCSFSGKLMTDAVELPCCGKVCSGNAITTALMQRGLRCPLCSTNNVSVDNLIVKEDIRNETKDFLKGSSATSNGNHTDEGTEKKSGWAHADTVGTSAIAKAWGQPALAMTTAPAMGFIPQMPGTMPGMGGPINPMAAMGMDPTLMNALMGTGLAMGIMPPHIESQLPPILSREDFEKEKEWQKLNPNAPLVPPNTYPDGMPMRGGFGGFRGRGRGYRGRGRDSFGYSGRGRGRFGRSYDRSYDRSYEYERSYERDRGYDRERDSRDSYRRDRYDSRDNTDKDEEGGREKEKEDGGYDKYDEENGNYDNYDDNNNNDKDGRDNGKDGDGNDKDDNDKDTESHQGDDDNDNDKERDRDRDRDDRRRDDRDGDRDRDYRDRRRDVDYNRDRDRDRDYRRRDYDDRDRDRDRDRNRIRDDRYTRERDYPDRRRDDRDRDRMDDRYRYGSRRRDDFDRYSDRRRDDRDDRDGRDRDRYDDRERDRDRDRDTERERERERERRDDRERGGGDRKRRRDRDEDDNDDDASKYSRSDNRDRHKGGKRKDDRDRDGGGKGRGGKGGRSGGVSILDRIGGESVDDGPNKKKKRRRGGRKH